MAETVYVCTKCKAKDTARDEHPPQVLNCWNCHAGQKMEIQEMLMKRVGMFPVARETEAKQ